MSSELNMDMVNKSMTIDPDTTRAMPLLSDMPLHEWIAALTHPVTGQFPRGITTRMMDSLVKRSCMIQFPSADRRRYHSMWKTISHFAVYLSEAARKGRIRRVSLGTYMGIFNEGAIEVKTSLGGRNAGPNIATIGKSDQHPHEAMFNRSSNKRKASFPRRHPNAFGTDKRVRVTSPNSDMPQLDKASPDPAHATSDRPPSCDSIDGGSGSSTDDCPIDQSHNGSLVLQKNKTKVEQGKVNLNSGGFVSPSAPAAKSSQVRKGMVHNVVATRTGCKPMVKRGHCRQHRSEAGNGPKLNDDLDEYGLPSLLKLEPSLKDVTVSHMSTLTSDDVSKLCRKLGFEEGADAFSREEVDGTALMLLRREDVMNNLGLKLGPALKLHRFVRTMQMYAKGAQ